MTPEWDPDEIERDWLDALALVGELLPTTDEVAERFHSEAFAATVTGADRRLLRLAEEAKDAATQGREIAHLMGVFADGVERRSAPLCRAAIYELRRMAEREHMLATSPDPTDEGGFGMLD